MNPADLILDILAKASSANPMPFGPLGRAVLKKLPKLTVVEIKVALAALCEQRRISTCDITRDGLTVTVYWPTGLSRPALAGIKLKELPIVPSQTTATEPSESIKANTKAGQLIKAIVAHGPIIGADLAEQTDTLRNSLDSILAKPLRDGVITTRVAFVPEQGRHLKHYMTATQAAEWDESRTDVAGHVMNHQPATEPGADEPGADPDDAAATHIAELEAKLAAALAAEESANARCDDLEDQVAGMKARIHDQSNDIAAAHLILRGLANTLKVDKLEDIPAALDELTHALATRAMLGEAARDTAHDKADGRMALLLIDSADLAEVEELEDGTDPRRRATEAIEQGHAARAIAVRIIGEAARRVEWKEVA